MQPLITMSTSPPKRKKRMINNLLPHLGEGEFYKRKRKRSALQKLNANYVTPDPKTTTTTTAATKAPPPPPRKKQNNSKIFSLTKPRNLLSSFDKVDDNDEVESYSLDALFERVDEIEIVLDTINEANRVVLSKIPEMYRTKQLMTFALNNASQSCSSELNNFDAITDDVYRYLDCFDYNDEDDNNKEDNTTTTAPSLLNRKRSYAPSTSKKKDSPLLILQNVCEEYLNSPRVEQTTIGEQNVSTLDLTKLKTYHVQRASIALKVLAFFSRIAELVVYRVIGNINLITSGASVESFVSKALTKALECGKDTSPLMRAAHDAYTRGTSSFGADVLENMNAIGKVLCEDVRGTIEATNDGVNFEPCVQMTNETCGRVPTSIHLENVIRTWVSCSSVSDRSQVLSFMIQNLSSSAICVHSLSLEVVRSEKENTGDNDDEAPMYLSVRHINIIRNISPRLDSSEDTKILVASVVCSRLGSCILSDKVKAVESGRSSMAKNVRGMWSIRFV